MIKQLDFQDRCNNLAFIIIILMITMIVRIIADGGEQQFEYYLYRTHTKQYVIQNAQVCEQTDVSFKLCNVNIIPITETIIAYEIGDKTYSKAVYSYSGIDNDNGIIPVAVKLQNNNCIVRCIPWTIENINRFFGNWIILAGLLIALRKREKIIDLLRRRQRKNTEEILENESISKSQMKKERVKRKQTTLLHNIARKEKISEECCREIIQQMQKACIPYNEDWLWCLRFLSSDKIMFINESWEDLTFITETLKMREKGLPDDYWIIDRKDHYYICCRQGHERIYAFSTNLGITNTQYEDIYDYIQKTIL